MFSFNKSLLKACLVSGSARFQEINGGAKIAIVPSQWKPALNSQSDTWQIPAVVGGVQESTSWGWTWGQREGSAA